MSSGKIPAIQTPTRKFYKSWSGQNSTGSVRTENAYSMTGWDGTMGGQIGLYSVKTGKRYGQLIPPWPNNTLITSANLNLEALAKLADNVRGHSFDLGNALGEGRQTYSMALSTISKFGRTAKNLKSGNLEGALRSLFGSKAPPRNIRQAAKRKLDRNDVAGSWLEMQYGWLPLISDVYESAKAWEAISNKPRQMTYRAHAKRSDTYDQSPLSYLGMRGPRSSSVRVKCTLRETISAPRSLGLLDPLGVAWELLPWSFAVDWFLPIGSYLDVLSVLPPSSVSKVVTSNRDRVQVKFTGILVQAGLPNTLYKDEGVSIEYKYTLLTRSVSASVKVPPPKFVNPWEAMGKGNRIFNAVALASQFFKVSR